MATLPDYLTDQTEKVILQNMLDSLPDDLDKTEGSYIWDSLDPAAIELALAAIWAQEILRRGFASTTFGDYLDLRCEEHGVTRKAAVKATGTAAKGNPLTISGTPGTIIAAGFKVATPADTVTNTASVEFITTAQCTIGAGGSITVDLEASQAGVDGNVPAGAISVVVTPVVGVTGVTNLVAMSGGTDKEKDGPLLERFLQKVRSPSAGGNKADYVNWTMEVAGVGGVSVVPVRDGAGTVSIAIIGTDKAPGTQALVDAVQNYIAPPWEHAVEAETMTIGGSGASIDNTQVDDTGDSVKMIYDAAGVGTITHSNIQTILEQPGIWQVRVRAKVDNAAGATDLLQIGVYNVTTGVWAKTRPGGATDAMVTLQADDLGLVFGDKIVDYYWNGMDQLELRITRLQTDNTTTVWVDQVKYRSTFSTDTGDGKAPVGAKVTVEPATSVVITVSATLVIASGYNADSVKSAVTQAIADYIKSLAFTDDNDVRYVRICNAILDTTGVQDYSNVTVNGGTVNITIGTQEVAVAGTVTLA